jgi:hypothetical protein
MQSLRPFCPRGPTQSSLLTATVSSASGTHGATRLFGYSHNEAMAHSLDLIIPERLRQRHWVPEEYRTARVPELRVMAQLWGLLNRLEPFHDPRTPIGEQAPLSPGLQPPDWRSRPPIPYADQHDPPGFPPSGRVSCWLIASAAAAVHRALATSNASDGKAIVWPLGHDAELSGHSINAILVRISLVSRASLSSSSAFF